MVTKVWHLLFVSVAICNGCLVKLDLNNNFFYKKITNPYGKKYYADLLNTSQIEGIQPTNINKIPSLIIPLKCKYPVPSLYFEEQLNSQNITSQTNGILNQDTEPDYKQYKQYKQYTKDYEPLQIHLNRTKLLEALGIKIENNNDYDIGPDYDNYSRPFVFSTFVSFFAYTYTSAITITSISIMILVMLVMAIEIITICNTATSAATNTEPV
jgi:hypothetical protein